jgi:hypothetical protein
MVDTAFANKIKELTDDELERRESSAYNIAYGESFGRDYEAHADAHQEYEMLARERRRRHPHGD